MNAFTIVKFNKTTAALVHFAACKVCRM